MAQPVICYSAHSRDPSFHSCNSPKIRTSKNENDPIRIMGVKSVVRALIIGNSKTISTSKIKKITASKKNRVEKGIRARPIGSKPHSNAECFSRSTLDRFEIIQANNSKIEVIKIAVKLAKKLTIIKYWK